MASIREAITHLRRAQAEEVRARQLAVARRRILLLRLFKADPDLLKRARGRLTQGDLAERTGVCQSQISELERGLFLGSPRRRSCESWRRTASSRRVTGRGPRLTS
jgi:hypothetical protein